MSRLTDKTIFIIKFLHDYFFPITPDTDVASATTLGNYGASFTIDPRGLDQNSVVYSFGVGFDISFDLALIENYGSKVYAFDPTPKSVDWLKKQKTPQEFVFSNIGIADYDGQAEFFPPENPEHVSHTMVHGIRAKEMSLSVKVERLSTIMKRYGHKKIDLLKMDIEGAEYGVIDDIIKEKLSVHQIVVEFHHRFRGFGILQTRQAVKKLKDDGYKLFSVSTNGEEFSFVKD